MTKISWNARCSFTVSIKLAQRRQCIPGPFYLPARVKKGLRHLHQEVACVGGGHQQQLGNQCFPLGRHNTCADLAVCTCADLAVCVRVLTWQCVYVC